MHAHTHTHTHTHIYIHVDNSHRQLLCRARAEAWTFRRMPIGNVDESCLPLYNRGIAIGHRQYTHIACQHVKGKATYNYSTTNNVRHIKTIFGRLTQWVQKQAPRLNNNRHKSKCQCQCHGHGPWPWAWPWHGHGQHPFLLLVFSRDSAWTCKCKGEDSEYVHRHSN